MRRSLLACLAVALIALAATAVAPARHALEAARCARGTTAATIGGKQVCLRVGGKCKPRYASRYRRYGFECRNGRLARRQTKPTPSQPPLPSSGTIAVRIAVDGAPSGVIVTDGAVWVTRHRAGALARIDPATNGIVADVAIPTGMPSRLAAGPEGLWLSNYGDSTVTQIDPAANRVVGEVSPSGENCCAIAVGAGSVWLQKIPNVLTRVDATTKKVLASLSIDRFFGVEFAYGSAWGTSGSDVVRIDPQTNAVAAHIPVPGLNSTLDCPCPWMGSGAGAVWVDLGLHMKVARIDPVTNTVAAIISLPGFPKFIAVSETDVWVVGDKLNGDTDLWRIDAATNKLVGELFLSRATSSEGLAVGAGSVWVSMFADNQLLRITPAG
jgi:streptogramin lyase